MNLTNSLYRSLLIVLGWSSFGLAILGVFLPLLPTTPFLLLSVFFFARSSPRFHAWLLNHRVFGPYIRDWLDKRSLSLKTKVAAIVMLVISMGTSAILFVPYWQGRVAMAVIGFGVIVYLLRIPTEKK